MSENLKDRLSKAITAYYAGDDRSKYAVSDEEYEELVGRLGLTPNQIEDLKRESIRVMDKIHHKWPMKSLDKTHSLDDVRRVRGGARVYQKKFDGCSLEVHYGHDGHMDYACTRGDYTYGENKTRLANVLVRRGRIEGCLPDYADSSIRGELLVADDDWKIISNEFKNQRNAASGISNRNDTVYAVYLTFIPYDVIWDGDGRKELYQGKGHADIYRTFEDAQDSLEHSPVTTDGIVIKDYVDDSLKEQVFAVAYKFSDKEYETRLRKVLWQMGKTGKLTPVAEFDPVFIDAEVTKASLGSLHVFQELNLHYNDRIVVKKANMVIPQVVANHGGGHEPIEYPRYWNGEQTWIEGKHLFTMNPEKWRDIMYAQVDNLAGKGISKSFVDTIFEEYGVTTLSEMYDAVHQDGFAMSGYGEKKLAKVRECLAELDNATLLDFIASLCIDGVQTKTAAKILTKVSYDAQRHNVTQYSILLHLDDPVGYVGTIKDIGEATAKSFGHAYSLLKDQLNDYSKTFGHYPSEYGIVRNDGPEIVVTGSFDGLKRKDVKELLLSNGYNVNTKVTSKTALLVAGNGGGKKRDAARALGVRVFETDGDFEKGAQCIEDMFNGKQKD